MAFQSWAITYTGGSSCMFLLPRSQFPQVELIHQNMIFSGEQGKKKTATNVPRVPCPQEYTHLHVRPDPAGSKLQRKGAQLQTALRVMYQSWRLKTGESVRNLPTTNQVQKSDVYLSSALSGLAGRGLIAFSPRLPFSPPPLLPPCCLSSSLVGRTVESIS